MAEFIWNGVGLTTPDIWEPSALERDGFLLEHSGIPVCELKWRSVQGTFAFEKHIKKLAKGNKAAEMHAVPNDETPEGWQQAVARLGESGIRSQSFIWQSGVHRGIGAALHNPGTGLAALVQFFISDDIGETIAADTLATFRDYTSGKTVPWAMFGMSARVPAEFMLDTFSFKPGHYTVKYWRPKSARQGTKLPAGKGPGTALVFERFAPASVLLKTTGLAAWAKEGMEMVPEKLPVTDHGNFITWAGAVKSSTLRTLLRREVRSMGRVWTTGTGNAILSVVATGTVPFDDESFTAIHESYVLV